MTEQRAPEDRAWDEIRLLQDTTMRVWQMYMNYFTWFYGINVFALSLVLTSEKVLKEEGTRKTFGVIMTGTICVSIVLAVVAACFFVDYYMRVRARAVVLEAGTASGARDVQAILGWRIGRLAMISIPIAFASIFVPWLYLAISVFLGN
jgi:hypothetical protein